MGFVRGTRGCLPPLSLTDPAWGPGITSAGWDRAEKGPLGVCVNKRSRENKVKFKSPNLVLGLLPGSACLGPPSRTVQALPSPGTPFPSTPILADPNQVARVTPLWAVKRGEAWSLPPTPPRGLSGSRLHPRSKSGQQGVSSETWQPPPPPPRGPSASRGGATSPPWLPAWFVLPEFRAGEGVPGRQVNPGGSQRRHQSPSQKLPAPRLPELVLGPTPSVTPSQVLAFAESVPLFTGHVLSVVRVPGPVLAARETKRDPAPAATDGGTGCSLHKSTQLRGERAPGRGYFFTIHTMSPVQVSGGPDTHTHFPSISVSHFTAFFSFFFLFFFLSFPPFFLFLFSLFFPPTVSLYLCLPPRSLSGSLRSSLSFSPHLWLLISLCLSHPLSERNLPHALSMTSGAFSKAAGLVNRSH